LHKLNWLQNRSQVTGATFYKAICTTCLTFRSKRRIYLKDKISKLQTNNNNKNIRDLHEEVDWKAGDIDSIWNGRKPKEME
jgi:hypothetical protein